MTKKRIAILSSVSFNLELVKRQLTNYSVSHGEQAKHFLHVANDGDINIEELKATKNIDIDAATSSFKTSNLCNFGGQIANSERLLASKENFGYVYIHTDADLIIQGNLADYINRHKCGFLKQKPSTNWPHYSKMMADPCFRALRKHLGINDDEIIAGRQEGAFFPLELWSEMTKLFVEFYPIDFFSQRNLLWPLEEGIVPTVATKLIETSFNEFKPTVSNIVITKPLKPSPDKRNPRDIAENCVNKEDIERTLAAHSNETCVAMKWFSRKLDDPAAKFVNERLTASSLVR